jgi:hypothetical protein
MAERDEITVICVNRTSEEQMQATFKIYRASHDPAREALVLAGKVVKGTVRAGMRASLAQETDGVAEFEISDIEMVNGDGACLLALVLAMGGRDAAGLLERGGLVGKSMLVTARDQE